MRRFHFLAATLACAALIGCHRPDVKVEETPIRIVHDEPGRGRVATPGRTVHIDYEIKLPSGETVLRHKDWRFVLGRGTVIEGIDEAVTGMRPGGERVVECPPHKHWGRLGYGEAIPPNTNLIFEIRLARVE